ncbi:hypothetical protein [Pararhizobium sp. PWRC1-1]|uniref:hypothetical protein n=1 Tax=Pararhizobium sp. PWRC1-1 TaxID=2804566 RepID=UPI003CF947E4
MMAKIIQPENMTDSEHDIAEIFYGRATYRKLKPVDGEKVMDAYLKNKLTEDHPWVGPFYDELSDFVHLSFRHFWPVLAGTDDANRTAQFVIHGQDPKKDEANYYDISDGFLRVTQLTSMLLVSFLMVRHGVPPTDYQKMWGVEGKKVGDELEGLPPEASRRAATEADCRADPELSGSDDPGRPGAASRVSQRDGAEGKQSSTTAGAQRSSR